MVSSRLRSLFFLAALGTVAGAIYLKRSQAVDVVATPVVQGKAVEAVYATGTVEAENRVEVKAKAAGSIAELFVREGSVVKKGDLLARIDNPVATYDLKRGAADLFAAHAQAAQDAPQLAALNAQANGIRAELKSARTDLQRTASLRASGGVPQADVDRAQARVEQLEGSLDANLAQQRALRIDLSARVARQSAEVQSLTARVNDTEVRAPLDGVVLDRRVELGEVVSVNQSLMLIGDTRSLILEVSVDEADVARISDGSAGKPPSPVAVSLLAFPKQVFDGSVFEILPDADRAKKAFLVKVRLAALPDGLRSGMTAEVNMITKQREGLLAPASAESEGQLWLVINGIATQRKVTTGIRDPLRVELLEGAKEGDLVILQGREGLTPGTRVNVTVKQPEKLEPMPDLANASKMSL